MRWASAIITAVILTTVGCTVQAQPKTDKEPTSPPGDEFLQPDLPHGISQSFSRPNRPAIANRLQNGAGSIDPTAIESD